MHIHDGKICRIGPHEEYIITIRKNVCIPLFSFRENERGFLFIFHALVLTEAARRYYICTYFRLQKKLASSQGYDQRIKKWPET